MVNNKKGGPGYGRWKGGRIIQNGYIHIWMPDHPYANPKGYIPEHVLIVEKATGYYLPKTAIVHHINKNRQDNSPSNLIVCQDISYHRLIHCRQDAYENCGHANWLRCNYCGAYDNPVNMYIRKDRACAGWHRKCQVEYQKAWKHKRKNQGYTWRTDYGCKKQLVE